MMTTMSGIQSNDVVGFEKESTPLMGNKTTTTTTKITNYHEQDNAVLVEDPSSTSAVSTTTFVGRLVEYGTVWTARFMDLWTMLIFRWLEPLLELGNEQKQLNVEDMDAIPLPNDCQTDHVMNAFQRYWNQELVLSKQAEAELNAAASASSQQSKTKNKFRLFPSPTPPSFVRALFYAFGWDFLKAGFLKLIHDLCIFVGPQVLHGLVFFLRDPNAPLSHGICLTVAVTISQLTMSFCLRHYFFRCYRTGLRIRSAVVVAVYQKALKLDASERQARSTGEITNLVSIDAQRMQDLTTYLHAVWYSFIQIGLALYFLFQQLGASCLGGVVIIVVMMPVTKTVAQWMGGMQRRLMKGRDGRVEVNAEALGNMKIVKFQAWEESFQQRILQLRHVELTRLWQYMLGSSFSILLWSSTPLLVALATFATYVTIAGQELEVASALTALALFDILRFPLFMLPQVLNRIVEAGVSMERIRSFLLCREHHPVGSSSYSSQVVVGSDKNAPAPTTTTTTTRMTLPPGVVILEQATFAYESNKIKFLPSSTTSSAGGMEMDAKTKALADKQWEIALLKSQLQDAEYRIRELMDLTNSATEDEEEEENIDNTAATTKDGMTAATVAEGEASDGIVNCAPPDHLDQYIKKDEPPKEQEGVSDVIAADVEEAKKRVDKTVMTDEGQMVGCALPEETPLMDEELLQQEDDVEQDNNATLLSNLLCLKRIDFSIQPGELVAVVGGVGCGKSSFLNAILGEVRALSGTTAVQGTLSYFAQTPFVLNDTVRNNILFGHTNDAVIDEDKYQRALSCCALRHDLEILPAGDHTEIGEKGVTLSGGQKARVALARAVYHAADLALLDDPLAAVDAHVGKHLFQKCIIEELLLNSKQPGAKKRSVILSTNALQYLSNPLVDRIIVVRDGRIMEQGTYKELSANSGSIFSHYLAVLAETGVSAARAEATTASSSSEDAVTTADAASVPGLSTATTATNSTDSLAELDEAVKKALKRESLKRQESTQKRDSMLEKKAKDGTLMTDEFKEREVGHVGREVYLAWGRAAGGIWVPLVIIIAYGLVEVMNVSSKWWLTYWSGHGTPETQGRFLMIYAFIGFAAIFATFLRLVLLFVFGLKAARKMFERMLEVVLQAPMSFFDTTPIGRIINRFSKDMNTVDENLITTLRSYLATLFSVTSTIIVISGVTPIFTLCLIPIIIFYLAQQAYFTMTYRELKRLDSIGRSPIYALLGETLDGVSTIRAFSAQRTLEERLFLMLDRQQHAYYLTTAAQCWLAVRLELAGTMIITFACLSSVLQHGQKGGDEEFAGLAGLAISYALQVTQSLNWSVRMASDFEANMVAVERIEQYSQIKSEAPRHTPRDNGLEANWPSRGEIQFVGAKLRYRPELPLVLKGLDIHIPAGAKVGVVGRTGAGKSTLMVGLMRIVELDSGRIYLDGQDHREVGLAKLRSKIAIIPQDPVLFSGTVRSNLDPFDSFSEDRLYEVLSRVGLYSRNFTSRSASSTSISSLANIAIQSLADPVSDGGSNFSVGQRQLLVIARALLCGASIVIMDEATAAVDADTDARIQSVMRSEFKAATCLTVAHRINTIMDSDYILVMDDGTAAEFDSPQGLLDRGGMFRDLVDAASAEEGNANNGEDE